MDLVRRISARRLIRKIESLAALWEALGALENEQEIPRFKGRASAFREAAAALRGALMESIDSETEEAA